MVAGVACIFGRTERLVAECDPQLVRHVIVDRAGMSLLVLYAKFRKLVENLMSFNFEFPPAR